MLKHIAIFASGSGSNAENIVRYFEKSQSISIGLILTNNPTAGVINRAERLGIPCYVFTRKEFYDSNAIAQLLKEKHIDWIVLAGFLWLIPENLLKAYPYRIINIHPALLPGMGGKGMYGMKVHEAVILNKANVSGITIHYVNERFDEGEIILKAECSIDSNDTPETLAAKIHALEYKYYPEVIEKLVGT